MTQNSIEVKYRQGGSINNLTREEVAKHNTPESSWIIVNGYVYDITTFAELHVSLQNYTISQLSFNPILL